MKVPQGRWLMMDEVGSTQDAAATVLEGPDGYGYVFAEHQREGRGRFRRKWDSRRGDSLTFSLIFHEYEGHSKPWLIGMAVAVAVAQAVGGRVQWPNDVLLNGKKVAGVLIELLPFDAAVKTPVVGVGVNLNQTSFPTELDHHATSLFLETERRSEPIEVAKQIIEKLKELPEPNEWAAIEPAWRQLDDTPGKSFTLPSGEQGSALGIDAEGALKCQVDGSERTVYAAEALTGLEVA